VTVGILARGGDARVRTRESAPGARSSSAALPAPGRTPPHPGRFLESRFMLPLGISQTALASALGISRRRVNELVNGRRAITPDTALRLALFFHNEPMFWMHLQVAWDMHAAAHRVLQGEAPVA